MTETEAMHTICRMKEHAKAESLKRSAQGREGFFAVGGAYHTLRDGSIVRCDCTPICRGDQARYVRSRWFVAGRNVTQAKAAEVIRRHS